MTINLISETIVQLSYPLYQDLLNHLQAHASTDDWANTLLQRLQSEAMPIKGDYIRSNEVYRADG